MLQTSQVVLSELTRDRNYEIVVVPFNSQGSGPPSPPVAVYVGEAVPTGQPRSVVAEPVSPTEVRLRWQPPQQKEQNGDLLGYKVTEVVKSNTKYLLPSIYCLYWVLRPVCSNCDTASKGGFQYISDSFWCWKS